MFTVVGINDSAPWCISPFSEDLRELERAVGDWRDEVEGRGAEVRRVHELVEALQQVIDHP